MKPGDHLFEVFSDQIDQIAPWVFAHEETRGLSSALLSHARENCKSVGMPRLGHYRTALQRQPSPEGVTVPNGNVYKTSSYEDFGVGDPAINYQNILVIQTNDKDDSKKSKSRQGKPFQYNLFL